MKTAILLFFCSACGLLAQEQTDKISPVTKVDSNALQKLQMRVRISNVSPAQEKMRVTWRRGGQGLGGETSKGEFTPENPSSDLATGEWTAWIAVAEVTGENRQWSFPNIAIHPSLTGSGRGGLRKIMAGIVESSDFEIQFSENGKVFKQFTETAPNGARVTLRKYRHRVRTLQSRA